MKTGSTPSGKPVLALLMRLLWTATLLLAVCPAEAGVVFTSLYSFTNGVDGSTPAASLVQGSDGNLYGTTWFGGTNGYGTVFKINTNGGFTSLHSFIGGTDGWLPLSGLVQGSDGSLYGTTSGDNGSNTTVIYGGGNVFKISTNGELTSLYTFGTNGANPHGGLVEGSDGNFYGTTGVNGWTRPPGGGVKDFTTYGFGTVFEISTNGALTNLHSFTGNNGGDGAYPDTGLVKGSDGYFYGTTPSGGATGGYGTVFQFSTNDSLAILTSLYTFTNGIDGGLPNGLVQGSDGNFYATTMVGGANNDGAVFSITTNGVLTTLYAFGTVTNQYGEALDGINPWGALVQGSDGDFYGTTQFSGTNGGWGTVFKIGTNRVLTSLHSFSGGSDGANPLAGLVQGSDGAFYGTTSSGGTTGNGTVFRLSVGLNVLPAAPVFQGVTITNGILTLSWSAEVGATYQLQYISDLSSSNWINLTNSGIATGPTLSTTVSLTNGPHRFYRLMFLQ